MKYIDLTSKSNTCSTADVKTCRRIFISKMNYRQTGLVAKWTTSTVDISKFELLVIHSIGDTSFWSLSLHKLWTSTTFAPRHIKAVTLPFFVHTSIQKITGGTQYTPIRRWTDALGILELKKHRLAAQINNIQMFNVEERPCHVFRISSHHLSYTKVMYGYQAQLLYIEGLVRVSGIDYIISVNSIFISTRMTGQEV